VLTDPGRTSPSTARADRRAPGVTGPGGSSRPCNGRRRRQQSTPRLDVQCPPTGRTSALGEGPARDWQIYESRGVAGSCCRSGGLRQAWEATQGWGAEEEAGAQRAQRRQRFLRRLLGPPGSSAAFEAAVRFVRPCTGATSLWMAYATTPARGTSALCELP
jgi:hypothetical protein